MSFNIEENLKKLPDLPGVYLHKDKLGNVIYVGKALSLRKRVRQYFQNYGKSTAKLRALVSQIAEFEYITCNTEMEALILECNLIKRYMPKYNVLLRDDKTYPYIKITSEKFPRIIKTRELKKDGARYFGPYSDATAVNQTVELLNEMLKLKRCANTSFTSNHAPCLNYHINQCKGVCSGQIGKEEYNKKIKEAIDFLNGNNGQIVRELKQKMEKASDRMLFEEAAKYRNYIEAINSIKIKQRVSMVVDEDMDILVPIRSKENSSVVLFPVRNGKLQGREVFQMNEGIDNSILEEKTKCGCNNKNIKDELNYEELISSFIKQYYSKWSNVPPEIIITFEMNEKEKNVLQEFLKTGLITSEGRDMTRKHKVSIIYPKKGKKKGLLDMALRDSGELKKTLDEKIKAREEKNSKLKEILDTILTASGYEIVDGKNYRVEAYDISNTNGVDSVGGMVVFQGTKPIKKGYRRFKIRTITGPDDYGSLREVLRRRFKRAIAGDEGFKIIPNIILMDGGLGQVSSAEEVLREIGFDIPIFGMEKDDKHRTSALVSNNGVRIELKKYPLLFQYLGRIQEEVHRFAISYHHLLHKKNTIKSVLDNIKGIGPAKRNALLQKFGSVNNIKKSSKEKLLQAPNITEKDADNIMDFFVDKK